MTRMDGPAPTDPVALERWLEEMLDEEEAATELKTTADWLAHARGTPGMGPKFKRYSAKIIRYRRRDLFAWLEGRTHGSTLEYRRELPSQTPEEALETPEEDGGGGG